MRAGRKNASLSLLVHSFLFKSSFYMIDFANFVPILHFKFKLPPLNVFIHNILDRRDFMASRGSFNIFVTMAIQHVNIRAN